MNEFYQNNKSDISISTIQNEEIFQNNLKQKILIIGNSHSIQSYQGFISNKKNTENIILRNFHIQIECFDETILKNKRSLQRKFDFKEKENFSRGVHNFKISDIVILSTRWTENDLNKLPVVIIF